MPTDVFIQSRARSVGRGFTLIELVVVILITAIVAGVAIASIGTTQSTRQKQAVRTLARDLSWLRERAIATQITNWVTFSTAGNSWTFLADNPASPGFASAVAITDPSTGQAFVGRWNVREFVGVTMASASTTSIGFDWMGRPVSSAGAILAGVVTITGSGSRTVTVQPQTGVVAWQ